MAALPCHRVDPELYFAETPADVEIAKANCAPCPVRAECLAGAQDRREPWGVWGGELFDGGAVMGLGAVLARGTAASQIRPTAQSSSSALAISMSRRSMASAASHSAAIARKRPRGRPRKTPVAA